MADTKQVKFGDRMLTVPADTTPEELDAILQPKGSGFENLRSSKTQTPAPGFFNPETPPAPYLGRLAANSAPAIGSAAGPGGTMIGTGVSAILKGAFPKVFGEPPESVSKEGLKDLVVNNIVPGGIEKGIGLVSRGVRAIPAAGIFKNFPAVREGAAQQMTSQILGQFQQPESQILEAGAGAASKNLGDLRGEINLQSKLHPPTSVIGPGGQQTAQFSPEVQAAMKDLEDAFGKNEVGKKLVRLHRQMQAGEDVAGSQTYKQIANTALSDIQHVRNWKIAAGEQGIEDLAINKLLDSGAGKEGMLDSRKILAELGGKNREIYGEAIRPQTAANFKDLINEIHSQQAGHEVSDSIVRYSKGRLIWASGLMGGIHGIMGIPGATAAGVTLTNSALSRAMSNPETARVVVEAMRTPAMSAKGQMINQILGNLWKGGADLKTVPEK